ncbi:MAG TPA: ABC transporter permease [Firmicutes bacterium]|nr:ABC transporter permease [Bacillota bacterium]
MKAYFHLMLGNFREWMRNRMTVFMFLAFPVVFMLFFGAIFAGGTDWVQKSDGSPVRNIDFLLPGVLGMALMQLGLFGSLRFISLRENKVFKRLGTTPVHPAVFVLAEITVRLLMAFMQAFLLIACGRLFYQVRPAGSLFSALALLFLGALAFVGLGYMIAMLVSSEETALIAFQLVQFPMMVLSGIFFPVEALPAFLRPLAALMPLTYLADGLRQIMVGVAPLFALSVDILVLCGIFAVTFLVAVYCLRWE